MLNIKKELLCQPRMKTLLLMPFAEVKIFFRRSVIFFILIISCLSCATTFPAAYYIQAEHPYKKRFHSSFEEVSVALVTTLAKHGWEIVDKAKPQDYEVNTSIEKFDKSVLFFTRPQRNNRLVYSQETRLNVYVFATSSFVDVEIRFLAVKHTPVKKFLDYRHDVYVKKILEALTQMLEVK